MFNLLFIFLISMTAIAFAGEVPSYLKKALMNSEFLVFYDVVGKSPEGTFEGETHWFKKGEKFRTDFFFHGNETRNYQLGDAYYTCFKFNGVWQCMEYSAPSAGGGESKGQGEFYTLEDLMKNEIEVKELPPKTILGEKTHCYSIKSQGQTSNVCVNDEGIVLFMEVKSREGTYVMRAKKYSRRVKDSAFSLPAKPSKFPAFPGLPQN